MKDLINQSLNIENGVTKNGTISNEKLAGVKEEAKNEIVEFPENLKVRKPGKINGRYQCWNKQQFQKGGINKTSNEVREDTMVVNLSKYGADYKYHRCFFGLKFGSQMNKRFSC